MTEAKQGLTWKALCDKSDLVKLLLLRGTIAGALEHTKFQDGHPMSPAESACLLAVHVLNSWVKSGCYTVQELEAATAEATQTEMQALVTAVATEVGLKRTSMVNGTGTGNTV